MTKKGYLFLAANIIAVLLAGSLITLSRISNSLAYEHVHVSKPVTTPVITVKPTPPIIPVPTTSSYTAQPTGIPATTSGLPSIISGTSPTPSENQSTDTLSSARFSMGSPVAPVKILMFSGFDCHRCHDFAMTVEKDLETQYIETGKVYLTYKFVLFNEEYLVTDEAAACAAEQSQFWPYYNLLMQQKIPITITGLPVEKLQGLAQQLGLDMEKFNNSLLSGKYEGLIRQIDQERKNLKLTGTPTFYINGTKLTGAVTLADLQKIIDPLLEKQGS